MISFNIDFLTNHLPKNRPRTERTQTAITIQLYNVIKLVQKKSESNLLRTAFLTILAKPRPKIQKLEIIEPIIRRKMQDAFLSMKRYSFKSHQNQIMPKQKQYNYPISIVQKVVTLKTTQFLQEALWKLMLNRRKQTREESILGKIEIFINEYIKRNIYLKGFRAIQSASNKSDEYSRHVKYFEYVFESARMRILFNAFTSLSIKMAQKQIAELEKEKGQKRVMANQGVVKRNEAVNELKRKLNNMKGQVSEGQILNNKKRVDGARQNGQKLIKKNEEMRVIEINTSFLEYDLFNLERQLVRKQDFIQGRAGNKMSFQQLKGIYEYIRYVDAQKDGKLIYSKLIPTSKQKQIQNKHSYVITQNVKLKHILSLYQKMSEGKKTDSYNNAQNENNSLKMLISSIFRTQFMEPQRESMLQCCNQIQEKMLLLNEERAKLKNI